MVRGWPAGVSKAEHRAYKAACEAVGMDPLGPRDFKADLDSGLISRDFFVDLIPKESVINIAKYSENSGGNVNTNTNRNRDNGDGNMVNNDGDESESDLIPVPLLFQPLDLEYTYPHHHKLQSHPSSY